MFEFFKSKNIKPKKINNFYSQHLYTGINGLLMRYCHKQLEESNPITNCKKILEIGAGSEPHYKYLKNKDCQYYILEKMHDKTIKKNKKIKYFYYNGSEIKFKKNYFDRVIISHTLEHIPSPEKFLKSIVKVVKKGGVISISLPADPGFLWRLGRLYNKVFKVKKSLNLKHLEYDYMNAIEHINSIYNLIAIIRYNFKNKFRENFLPFKIKIIDLNLFYNVHIIK
jgi:phosphatidylethanolamine/phosphatidyl-N-methylethanolamine N-methyltransferase